MREPTRAVLRQNLKDALTDIESALKRSERENPEFLDTRGYLLYLLDRPEDALKDMNRAIGDFEPVVYREVKMTGRAFRERSWNLIAAWQ